MSQQQSKVVRGYIAPLVVKPGEAGRMLGRLTDESNGPAAVTTAERVASASSVLFHLIRTVPHHELAAIQRASPQLGEAIVAMRKAFDGGS